jgi:diguanylate cyclase (GGDEF)-like protein
MALVLFDLDHFSQVNSRHGHLAGDRLLEGIGRSLRELESDGVAFGRLGGEEFAVLLPRAGLDEGLAFAERCRAAIATTQVFALDERTVIEATASFGVVSTAAAGYRLRDLLSNADHALYRAKGAGRNRVAAAVVVPVGGAHAACSRRSRSRRPSSPRPRAMPRARASCCSASIRTATAA